MTAVELMHGVSRWGPARGQSHGASAPIQLQYQNNCRETCPVRLEHSD